MQKVHRHTLRPKSQIVLRWLCKYMVSGSFNSSSRGSFHLSVTLLFAIGRRVVLSLGGWAPLLPAEFHELRAALGKPIKAERSLPHTGLSPSVVCRSRHFC